MKFFFCGHRDAPDWILAVISELAELSNIRFKLVCVQILNFLKGEEMDMEKIAMLLSRLQDTSETHQHTLIAGVQFILEGAMRSSMSHALLSDEMEQCGFPPEHARALRRPYEAAYDAILSRKNAATLIRNPPSGNVTWSTRTVCYGHGLQEAMDVVSLRLNERVAFDATRAQMKALEVELSRAMEVAQAVVQK